VSFGTLSGWPAVLALACCALPGRGPQVGGRVAAVLGLVVAVVLLAVYFVGLLLLPAAVGTAIVAQLED
jgi:hypothetical protein